MTRNNANAGTRTVDCNDCGTDTEPMEDITDFGLCPDCMGERARKAYNEDTHIVECRECGEPTEANVSHDTTTCIDCHREAGRLPATSPSV